MALSRKYLRNEASTHYKHYFVAVLEAGSVWFQVMTGWGRIGARVQDHMHAEYSTRSEAMESMDALVHEKLERGYLVVWDNVAFNNPNRLSWQEIADKDFPGTLWPTWFGDTSSPSNGKKNQNGTLLIPVADRLQPNIQNMPKKRVAPRKLRDALKRAKADWDF